MPIVIVEKRKTEPEFIGKHKSLVPLRCVKCDRSRIYDAKERTDMDLFCMEAGDIVFRIGTKWGRETVINVTREIVVDTKNLDKCTFIRAYDIQQIILTNDDEPAPVV